MPRPFQPLFRLVVTLLMFAVFNHPAHGQTREPDVSPVTAIPDALDLAVSEAIDRFNTAANGLIRYREVGRLADSNGAIIYLEVVHPETGIAYPGVIDWLHAARTNGLWQVAAPGDATYRATFRRISATLQAEADVMDRQYRTQATPGLVARERLLDYELPFPAGAFGTITRSFNLHGTGRIDFDLTAREIAAVKDGVIVFASDRYNLQTYNSGAWWYWNAVIIRHGENEYSLYGHLAQDSIPGWIKDGCGDLIPACEVPVLAGDVIGLEGNTGNSTNPHLHIEFGQGYGVVPYPDLLDADMDSVRTEAVYAGYVYAEHNVGFVGYSPDESAEWPYLTVLQAGAVSAEGD